MLIDTQTTHLKMSGTKLLPRDLLLNITGGSIGRCCIMPSDFDAGNINQHVAIIRTVTVELGGYLHKVICSSFFQNEIVNVQTGAGREGLPKNKMDNMLIPLPPLQEQKAIVAKVEKLLALCDQLDTQITDNQSHAEQLMQSVLKEAFTEKKVQSEKTNVVKFNPTKIDYYKRILLAAEIVDQLHKERTLGHLKVQKLIFLCQRTENMQLPTNFLQQVAGPYDPTMARSIDKQLKLKKWYEYQREGSLKYKPLDNSGSHKQDFNKYFSNELYGIQFLIDTFRKAKSSQIEVVATLYACWEKLLQQNIAYSEVWLMEQFYDWSEEKEKYTEVQIKAAIKWMQEKGIVPH